MLKMPTAAPSLPSPVPHPESEATYSAQSARPSFPWQYCNSFIPACSSKRCLTDLDNIKSWPGTRFLPGRI